MKRTLMSAAVAALVSMSGCENAIAPEVQELDDEVTAAAALVAADAALEDLAAMNDALPSALLGSPGLDGPLMGPRSDLVRSRTVSFFDAAGGEQDRFDRLTTASVHSVMSLQGEISRAGYSASVTRSRDMWVTGLEGEEAERTWDGDGTATHARSRVTDDLGTTRSYEMAADASIDAVVRAVDRHAQPWPLSGSITRHVQVTIVNGPHGDETRSRTAILTFNGTQFATLEVDGVVFEVDLGARDHQNPVRRRDG